MNNNQAFKLLQDMIEATDELQTDPAYVQAMRLGQAALKEAEGCECCIGDEALYWKDNENNAFVDSKGEVLVTVKDHVMRFQVKCCPNCGRKFMERQL